MTYQELLEQLSGLSKEQLQQDVTIVALGLAEALPILDCVTTWHVEEKDIEPLGINIAENILDKDSVYLTIDI